MSDTFYNSGEKKLPYKRVLGRLVVLCARHKIQRIQRSIVNIFINYSYIGDTAFFILQKQGYPREYVSAYGTCGVLSIDVKG